MLDQRRADHRSFADHDLPEVFRQSGLDQLPAGPQGGERGLGVGLHHHRVAGREGGQRVTDGELQRVVPGRDLPDHPARPAQFHGPGEDRDRADAVLRPEVGGRLEAVVPGRRRDDLHLFVGVQPGLAGLHLVEVEHLGLAGEQQVVEAQQDGAAPARGGGGPLPLGGPGPVERLGDLRRARLGQVGQLLAGQRGVTGGGAAPDDAPGQPGHQIGGDDVLRAAGGAGRGRVSVGGGFGESVMPVRLRLPGARGYP